jgi:hypothetical protein
LELDKGSIRTDDAIRTKEKTSGCDTDEGDGNECLKEEFNIQKLKSFHNFNDMIIHNISTCCYCVQLATSDVKYKGNKTANEDAELENSPKDCDGFAFVLFEGVGHHDFTLGGP